MTTLFVDIGNSRLKWRCGDEVGRIEGAVTPAELDRWLSLNAQQMVVASVGDGASLSTCQDWALARGVSFTEAKTTAHAAGVHCAYKTPRNLGIDRWLAIIAAHHLHGAACVADVGTALTLDAVDTSGKHLGGLIAAGPTLARDSVVGHTAGVFGDDPVQAENWWAADTPQAISSGAVLGCAKLIDGFATATFRKMGPCPLLLCGGAATIVAPWLDSRHDMVGNLVLDGLALWHQDRRQ